MIRTPGQSSQLSEGDRKRTVSYCSRDSSGEEGKEEDSLSSGSSSSIGHGGSVRENLVDGSHREVAAVTNVDPVVLDWGRVRSTGLDEGGTDDSVREDGTSEPGEGGVRSGKEPDSVEGRSELVRPAPIEAKKSSSVSVKQLETIRERAKGQNEPRSESDCRPASPRVEDPSEVPTPEDTGSILGLKAQGGGRQSACVRKMERDKRQGARTYEDGPEERDEERVSEDLDLFLRGFSGGGGGDRVKISDGEGGGSGRGEGELLSEDVVLSERHGEEETIEGGDEGEGDERSKVLLGRRHQSELVEGGDGSDEETGQTTGSTGRRLKGDILLGTEVTSTETGWEDVRQRLEDAVG
jgi:hypothetical protein